MTPKHISLKRIQCTRERKAETLRVAGGIARVLRWHMPGLQPHTHLLWCIRTIWPHRRELVQYVRIGCAPATNRAGHGAAAVSTGAAAIPAAALLHPAATTTCAAKTSVVWCALSHPGTRQAQALGLVQIASRSVSRSVSICRV